MIYTKLIAQHVPPQIDLDQARAFCESSLAYFEKNNIYITRFSDVTDLIAADMLRKLIQVYETRFDTYDFPQMIRLRFSTRQSKGKCHDVAYQNYRLPGINMTANSTVAQIRNILRAAIPENQLEHTCRALRLELLEQGVTVQWTRQTDIHAVRNTLLKLKELLGTLDLSCIKMITIANDYSVLSQKAISIKERAPMDELTTVLENAVRTIKE